MTRTKPSVGHALGYVAGLDGLRAVAVLAVMGYHAQVAWLPGGFLGVDFFFVLSGFLITSLLLQEARRWDGIDLLNFWRRRARRLLPALFLVVALTVLAVRVWVPRSSWDTARGDALSTLFYVANWDFVIHESSYFDQYSDPSPFRHMWSLAIEEQFYLVFPLLILFLLPVIRRRPRLLFLVFVTGALLSAWWMNALYDPRIDPSRVYYGTDTRAQELLVGAAAAALTKFPPRWLRGLGRPAMWDVAAGLGLVGMAWYVATSHDTDSSLYRGGFLVVSVATAVVVATVFRSPSSLVSRLLALRPLVVVGLMSYGLYLWHWPVFVLLSPERTGLDGPGLLALRFVVTFLGAGLSYVLLERPIRRGALTRLGGRVRGVVAGVLPLPATAALALLLLPVIGGTPSPDPALPQPPSASIDPASSTPRTAVSVFGDATAFTLAVKAPASVSGSTPITGKTSLYCDLLPVNLRVGDTTHEDPAECADFREQWEADLAEHPPRAVVMMFGEWQVLDHFSADGSDYGLATTTYRDDLTRAYTQALDAVGGQAPVVLVHVPCYQDTNRGGFGGAVAAQRNQGKRQQAVNEVIDTAAAGRANVTVVDLDARFCHDPKRLLREDGVHFTERGAEVAWQQLIRVVDRVAPRDDDSQHSSVTTAALLGDSVPWGLASQYPTVSRGDLNVMNEAKLGCSLLPELLYADDRLVPEQEGLDCSAWFKGEPQRLKELSPDVGVVFLGIAEQFDRQVNGRQLQFGTDEYADWLTSRIDHRIGWIRAAGAVPMLVNVPCHQVIDSGTAPQPAIINDQNRIDWLNNLADDLVASRPDVIGVDLATALCPDGFTSKIDGIELRPDGMHFGEGPATAWAWDWLAPQILEAAQDANRARSN